MRSLDYGLNARATNTTSAASNFIRVSQGEANGIGLEVFFKSVLLFAQSTRCVLYASQDACEATLVTLGIPYRFETNKLKLSEVTIIFKHTSDSAFAAFKAAIDDMQNGDVLFTLPAAKASFPAGAPGHTAYLRQYAKRDLGMFFHAHDKRVLLLSDHVSLDKVKDVVSVDSIITLISTCIDSANRFLNTKPSHVLIAGINPHAGEGGVLGNDQAIFVPAIKALSARHKDVSFFGPLPGDTMFNQACKSDWLVFSSHDQGLAAFKAKYGVNGANITLGLDFLRLSVDHGTATDKYGLNKANYMGCLYCLELAARSLGKV